MGSATTRRALYPLTDDVSFRHLDIGVLAQFLNQNNLTSPAEEFRSGAIQ